VHEMGIANSVLEAVRVESLRFPDGHIYKVGVRIGELAGVAPDALRFSFEALLRGSELEPLTLEIDYCPRRYQCRACAHEYPATISDLACPRCGAVESLFLGGDELELSYLEVENGACVAGT
jgi:hydrogenase nickel incorporation protein HypA/HybF